MGHAVPAGNFAPKSPTGVQRAAAVTLLNPTSCSLPARGFTASCLVSQPSYSSRGRHATLHGSQGHPMGPSGASSALTLPSSLQLSTVTSASVHRGAPPRRGAMPTVRTPSPPHPNRLEVACPAGPSSRIPLPGGFSCPDRPVWLIGLDHRPVHQKVAGWISGQGAHPGCGLDSRAG